MKNRQIFSFILLLWLLILPFISIALAAEKPDYVGINENDVIIWDTQFDQGPYENYLEDLYDWSDEVIEAYLDANPICDGDTDEKVIAWKYVIIEIKDEKEEDLNDDPFFQNLEDDEYKVVPYLYNFYTMKENRDDWKKADLNEKGEIYKYDRDLYARFIEIFGPSRGLSALIISKGVNWDRVTREADEYFGHRYEDAGASIPKETVFFFFEQDANGVKTYIDLAEEPGINDDVGDFGSISIYTSDGILKHYEWTYDGDPIYMLDLRENFFVANWWIIAIVAAVAVVIIIVVVIIKKR